MAGQSRFAFSIHHKLIGLIGLVVVGVVGGLATYLSSRQIDAMTAGLNRKAAAYATLMGKQTASAVAFSDRETAREVLSSLSTDHDVASVVLFDANGVALFSSGAPSGWVARAVGVERSELFTKDGRISAVVPVVSLEGPRGTLVIELSTSELSRARAHVAWTTALTALGAILIGGLAAWGIARSIAGRLRAIATVATKVADGDLEQREVDDPRGDEIGMLARAFNKMLAQLRGEQERLEALVDERTAQLDRRNAEMRLVFDHVDQGLLTVSLGGAIADERSAAVERWLGPIPDDRTLQSFVRAFAPERAGWFALAWGSLSDDFLPIELALSQLPARFEVGGRHLDFSYKPLVESDGTRVLIVITDVTAAVQREAAERDERETAAMLGRLLRDRRGAIAFHSEVSELIAKLLAGGDDVEFRRALHTLKGICAVEGVMSMADLCHHLETVGAEDLGVARARAAELEARWQVVTAKVREVIEASAGKIDVDESDLSRFAAEVERGATIAELSAIVSSWRNERVALRLERFAEAARLLAERLGKEPVVVQVDADPGLRLPEGSLAEFWSAFSHPVRNAVDHGLLDRAGRIAAGRSEVGHLTLRAAMDGGWLTIEISDDGAGVDWEKVAAAARGLGLPAQTREDLVASLFHDGLTTRAEATGTSGRGVGMAALRHAVENTGGQLSLESSASTGTRLRFTWPARVSRRSYRPMPRLAVPDARANPSH